MTGWVHGIDTPRRRFCLRAAAWMTLAGAPHAVAARTKPGARIACTDWAAAESLAYLGHMPIAVPELAVYRQWLPRPALPAATVDLGSRSEPNLELLSSLALDLIFISSWQAGMLPLFRKIAPTDVATIFDARRDPYIKIRRLLVQAGQAAGAGRLAASRLAEFDAGLDQLRASLAGAAHRSVYVAVLHENGAQAFVYGQGSWVDAIIRRLGLRNAWTGGTSFYGNRLVGIPALAADRGALILYLDQGARTRRAEALLRDSTLWRSLPAVAAGRARAIPSFYALGGVPSAQRCAHLITAAVTSMETR